MNSQRIAVASTPTIASAAAKASHQRRRIGWVKAISAISEPIEPKVCDLPMKPRAAARFAPTSEEETLVIAQPSFPVEMWPVEVWPVEAGARSAR